MATQLVGPGRVLFVSFDSTYRWRYVTEQTFDGFVIRCLAYGHTADDGGLAPQDFQDIKVLPLGERTHPLDKVGFQSGVLYNHLDPRPQSR